MIDLGPFHQTLELLNVVFEKYPQITQVILFGSRAKGTARDTSDVDLAIAGIDDDLLIESIALALDELPTPYQFDVKAFSNIHNPKLKDHIERIGITIFQRQAESR
jgi:predicted nucleotidyltransferase